MALLNSSLSKTSILAIIHNQSINNTKSLLKFELNLPSTEEIEEQCQDQEFNEMLVNPEEELIMKWLSDDFICPR